MYQGKRDDELPTVKDIKLIARKSVLISSILAYYKLSQLELEQALILIVVESHKRIEDLEQIASKALARAMPESIIITKEQN